MRSLKKLEAPAELRMKWFTWTRESARDPLNKTKKNRYKIAKNKLLEETSNKCVYCESPIGDTYWGDVEHIIPHETRPAGRFCWNNLTIACAICNNYKGTYYNKKLPYLNPYKDDVESMLIHQGPIVYWVPGNLAAEQTVKILHLHDKTRIELIKQKIEYLEVVSDTVAAFNTGSEFQKEYARLKLADMRKETEKFSGMVIAVLKGVPGI